jgi:hypothetical protein
MPKLARRQSAVKQSRRLEKSPDADARGRLFAEVAALKELRWQRASAYLELARAFQSVQSQELAAGRLDEIAKRIQQEIAHCLESAESLGDDHIEAAHVYRKLDAQVIRLGGPTAVTDPICSLAKDAETLDTAEILNPD